MIDVPQCDQNACTNIEFAGFVFCICCAPDIAAPPLQFCAQFFLRELMCCSQPSQIAAHVAVTPDFLFHCCHHFLTSIGCKWLYFMLKYRRVLTAILVKRRNFLWQTIKNFTHCFAGRLMTCDVIDPLERIPLALPYAKNSAMHLCRRRSSILILRHTSRRSTKT